MDNLPTRVQFDQLLASIANLNTEVDRLPTSSQFDRLTDKIDHLTYNTKACCCDEKRTDKGTALLSLKDRDGVMVNTNQTSQLCSIGKPPLHPSLPPPLPSPKHNFKPVTDHMIITGYDLSGWQERFGFSDLELPTELPMTAFTSDWRTGTFFTLSDGTASLRKSIIEGSRRVVTNTRRGIPADKEVLTVADRHDRSIQTTGPD